MTTRDYTTENIRSYFLDGIAPHGEHDAEGFDRWLADQKAEGFDEACQALAWCLDNGPAEDALPYMVAHNPYRREEPKTNG